MGLFRRRSKNPPKGPVSSAGEAAGPAVSCKEHRRPESSTAVFEINVSELSARASNLLDRSKPLTEAEQSWYNSFEEKLRARHVDLSLVPSGAVDMMALINDPSCHVGQMAEAISVDPVLAGSVIGAANSPLYRGSVEVTDLKQATVRLGQNQLRLVLMTALMNGALVKGQPFEQFSVLIWKHSLFVARLARTLGERAEMNPEWGYMAGLFHNLGKLAILSAAQSVDKKSKSKVTPRTLLQLLHVHGYSINARTIGEWKLVREIEEAVTHYRARPGGRYGGPYAFLVGLADAVCQKYGIWAEERHLNLDAHPALKELEVNPRHLPSISELNHLAEEIDQIPC
jgi:HD-like signal output (HDOD) protein